MAISPGTFPVGAGAPVPIYPYGLQDAITVTNQGTVTVYLSNDPVLSGGYQVEAGRSIGWEAGRKLYAYTTTGDTVIQIVEGSVTGQGSVTVSSIAAPVLVQGGGEFLVSGTAAVPFNDFVDVEIPAPASGLKFPSMELTISRPVTNLGEFAWQIYSQDSAGNYISIVEGVLNSIPSSASIKWFSQDTFSEKVLFPFTGNYPARLRIQNLLAGAGTQDVDYLITGGQRETPTPVTTLTKHFLTPRLVLATGATYDVYLPPSHTPYIVHAWDQGTASPASASVYIVGTGFSLRATRPLNHPIWYSTNDHYEYVYPGHGVPELLQYTVTGGVGAYLWINPFT